LIEFAPPRQLNRWAASVRRVQWLFMSSEFQFVKESQLEDLMTPKTGMIVKFFEDSGPLTLGILTISGLPGPVVGYSPNGTHWQLGKVDPNIPNKYIVHGISLVDEPSFMWSASDGFIVLGKRSELFSIYSYGWSINSTKVRMDVSIAAIDHPITMIYRRRDSLYLAGYNEKGGSGGQWLMEIA
jgi:hypothetical protein